MSVHSFQTVQWMPISMEQSWSFFSDPANLTKITPDGMGFKIISKFHGPEMYQGQIIEYKVSPVLNIPLYWMTEITHVQPGKFFVDEQRFGPYSLWHHQHHFKPMNGGTEMIDIVHYKLPLGFIGDIANTLFVKKKLEGIFEHRRKRIDEMFGAI